MSKGRERPSRTAAKKVVVFCEGSTERNYINGFKSWLHMIDPSFKVSIKAESFDGGGYADLLRLLRREPDSACIARIAVFDFDRYINHPDERKKFEELVKYSKSTKNKRVPCILVASNPNFEYSLCCHDPLYTDGSEERFLIREWGYDSIADCKADTEIWEKAHIGSRSHEKAIDHLTARPHIISNDLKVDLKSYLIKMQNVTFDKNAICGKGANFRDLFKVVGQ